MFMVDPREYQPALNQAPGDLCRAEANRGKTQLDVAWYTPLAKEGGRAIFFTPASFYVVERLFRRKKALPPRRSSSRYQSSGLTIES